MTVVCGIDTGRHGGLCWLDHGGKLLALEPMPDTLKSIKILFENRMASQNDKITVWIEDLSVHPQFSRTGIMTSARHLGAFEGIFEAYGISYTLVRPQEWQSIMYSHPKLAHLEGKARSIAAAKILCPDINLKASSRARTDSDGLADAYLIARYGMAVA